VAEAFLGDNEWPVFDYLMGTFDEPTENVAELLASFPRFGRWNYGAVWWVGVGQVSEPTREQVVGLTVLGAARSTALSALADVFFDVIELTISRWRTTPVSTRKARELSFTDEDVASLIQSERRLDTPNWPLRVYKLMEREPSFSSSGTLDADRHWTKWIPREVYEYEGVKTIEDYVTRLERLTAFPRTPVALATPSPLDLVAALDHLDAVWRAEHSKRHLFTYLSAEKTAKLAHPANTREEFDSRLSALAEILRSARESARAVAGSGLPNATTEHPLAPWEKYLVGAADPMAEVRVRQAVRDLEHALAVRDAAQHTDAGGRAVRALEAFGIGYPIDDAPRAWQIISARVVEALGAIREELSSAFS
jgi:hypothetical protein